jgi:16S rRNA C967 or C1407 C5-methylase (RsmB/RsmF family)/NOL1/NOP2/fmu family ribosome biogenesis protein
MRLPEALLRSLDGTPGFDRERFITSHDTGRRATSIRMNPAKWTFADTGPLVSSFSHGSVPGIKFTNIPWCEEGYHLDVRPSFTFDPFLHAGAYYVQEASSMFLGHALRKLTAGMTGLRALDLCAAPGGKSTHLSSIPSISLLVSNEIIRSRVPILCENLVKWGAPHVFISQQDPRDYRRLPAFFDIMLVDAPCSGSGLFRKDQDAVDEWSPNNVALCSQRQQRILADALPALRENGILVYSTCSYSPEENEEILDWLVNDMGMESLQIEVSDEWGITETSSPAAGAYGYRFYPHLLEGEGLFLACLRQQRASADSNIKNLPRQAGMPKGTDLHEWIQDPGQLTCQLREDELIAVPASIAEEQAVLAATLSLRHSGIRLGKLVRGRLIPDHELALSSLINPGIPACELTHPDAIRYLKKENIFPEGAVQGWNLVRYETLPLGFIKCMPGRANNYYPSGWRIRAEKPYMDQHPEIGLP